MITEIKKEVTVKVTLNGTGVEIVFMATAATEKEAMAVISKKMDEYGLGPKQ